MNQRMSNHGELRQTKWIPALVLVGAVSLLPVVFAQEAPPEMEPASEETLGLLAKFFDYDKSIPLEARIVERKTTDSGIREKIVLRGAHGSLAPGYLECPETDAAPYPCVLLLHGWSGSKASWWKGGKSGYLRTALLESGYAVFALDAPTHGDRIAENDYAGVNDYQGPGNDGRKNYFTVPEIIIQCSTDYRRGIDYLETREEIDAERVGQFHLAGHTPMGEGDRMFLLDTHVGPTPDPVWDLYRYALKRLGSINTLIEWDESVPAYEVVVAESTRAAAIEAEVMNATA